MVAFAAMTPNPPPPPYSPATPGAPAGKTPTMAIVALTLSILGFCFVCTSPIGVILGIIGLVKAPPDGRGKGLSIAAIIVGVVGSFFALGMTAAIAVPNFIKFQAQAKQAECKAELASIHASAVAFQGERGTFPTSPADLGFQPSNNRYTYFLSETEVVPPSHPQSKPATLDDLSALAGEAMIGVDGSCPDCTFTAVCAGNLDSDDTFDVWSISTADRSDEDGTLIPAGEPHHDLDDVQN